MHSVTNLIKNWLGRSIDIDGVNEKQCVDVAKLYMRDEFGVPNGAYGDAINYWNHPAGAILAKFDRIATTDIQEGDIVIVRPNHIGVATGTQTSTNFQMIAQNGGSGNGDGIGDNAIRIQTIRKSSIAGVLRPKNSSPAPAPAQPAPAPQPTVSHPYSVTPIAPKQVVAKINATEWNLDNTAWGGFKTNPVSTLAPNTPITVTAIANHNLGGRYYMKDASQPHGFNIVDMADYVAIAPPAPQPVAQPIPAKPANTTYTKLESPLNLVVNKNPTHIWALDFADYKSVQSVSELAQGASFVAYGKAQRTDLDRPCYYMTEADFGNADTTGAPASNVGINTVDLSPAPAPAPQPQPEVQPAVPVEQPQPAPLSTADLIPVKVLPSANPEGWKTSYKTNSAGEYVASTSTKVYDISNPEAPEQQLQAGLVVNVAGTFVGPNGIKYYRTKRSADNGLWYGIPQICLAAENLEADNTTLLNEDFITAAREELGKLSIHERIIRLIASLQVRLFHKK